MRTYICARRVRVLVNKRCVKLFNHCVRGYFYIIVVEVYYRCERETLRLHDVVAESPSRRHALITFDRHTTSCRRSSVASGKVYQQSNIAHMCAACARGSRGTSSLVYKRATTACFSRCTRVLLVACARRLLHTQSVGRSRFGRRSQQVGATVN